MAAIDGFDELVAPRQQATRCSATRRPARAHAAQRRRDRPLGRPGLPDELPDTPREGTHRAAERLRRSIAAAPFTVGPETVELTASVGWADWRGEDPSEFQLRVERSLRQAREAGGDVVRPETAS